MRIHKILCLQYISFAKKNWKTNRLELKQLVKICTIKTLEICVHRHVMPFGSLSIYRKFGSLLSI